MDKGIRKVLSKLLLLVCCIPLYMATALADDILFTAEEQAWLTGHPVIRVHNEMNWPPFNFNVDGKPTGFSIDYMNLVADKVGLNVEYISGPSWQEFIEMIQSGELDVISNATPTEERREFMQFTSAFYDQPVAVVVEDSNAHINTLDDLRGKRVAVVEGFFHQQFMERKYPGAELVLQKDVMDGLFAVLEGRADAMISSLPPTKYLIDQNSLVGLRIASISRDPELVSSGGLAVRKDWPVLRDILQKGMEALDNNDVTALRNKWFGLESTQTSAETNLNLTSEERVWIADGVWTHGEGARSVIESGGEIWEAPTAAEDE